MIIDARERDMSQFTTKERKAPMTIGHWATVIAKDGIARAKEQYDRAPLPDKDPEKVWRNAILGLAIADIYHSAEPKIKNICPSDTGDSNPILIQPSRLRLKSQGILGKMDLILKESVDNWIRNKKDGLRGDIHNEALDLDPFQPSDTPYDPLANSLIGGIRVQLDNQRASLITLVRKASNNDTRYISHDDVIDDVDRTYMTLLSPHAGKLHLEASRELEVYAYTTRTGESEEDVIIGYDETRVEHTNSGLVYVEKSWKDIKDKSERYKKDISDITGCPAHLSSRITRLVFDPSAQPAYDNVIHGLHKQFITLMRK